MDWSSPRSRGIKPSVTEMLVAGAALHKHVSQHVKLESKLMFRKEESISRLPASRQLSTDAQPKTLSMAVELAGKQRSEAPVHWISPLQSESLQHLRSLFAGFATT